MKYTKHARLRTAERGINEDMILKAILKPTQAYYDLSTGATVAFKKLNKKHVLVVYAMEENEIRIVTTFITSSAQELIDRKLESNVWVKVK